MNPEFSNPTDEEIEEMQDDLDAESFDERSEDKHYSEKGGHKERSDANKDSKK